MFSATPQPDIAVDSHIGELVHPAAVVARMSAHFDIHRRVDADGDAVRAIRIQYVDCLTPLPAGRGAETRSVLRTGLSHRSKLFGGRAAADALLYTLHTYSSSGIGFEQLGVVHVGQFAPANETPRRSPRSRRFRRRPRACTQKHRAPVRACRACRSGTYRTRRALRSLSAAPLRGRRPRACAIRESGSRRLGVVVGLEFDAVMLELAPDHDMDSRWCRCAPGRSPRRR